MDKKLCTVIVNSSDNYHEAWSPFFALVKKYWSDCPYDFVLNTQTKSYANELVNVTTFNYSTQDIPQGDKWGKRLKHCLDSVNTPFVILLLEDFFLHDHVNQFEINKCIEIMQENQNIVSIYFKRISGYSVTSTIDQRFILLDENKRFKCNLQASLWNRYELSTILLDEDTPWSFEEYGHLRIRDVNKVFLCTKEGTHSSIKNAVFPYYTDRRMGYGIWSGKWLWNNSKLFKKNNIQIDRIKMKKFTRLDMVTYYIKRVIVKSFGKFVKRSKSS
ncbi:hypothetical protein [Acholeplasma laidlawii]|uniref:hypothetical protein n=1 Tax=Acholeplasma laidlawii TaxID=2148 RepID=UPI0021F6E19B|nr:hypothetical protein [Acholeplasma laidlawii]